MLPILLSLLFPLSSAFPTHSLTARNAPTTESWHIPRLQMHMMSSSTGLPGPGSWPVSAQFNSSIDFDIVMPYFSNKGEDGQMMQVNCKASWLNGTLPEGIVGCGAGFVVGEAGEKAEGGEEGDVQFGMQVYEGLGVRRPELSFLLSVSRGRGVDSQGVALQGQVYITANDASEPSSYLTCLLGAPLDGLRCQIGSYLSVRKELVIEGSTSF